MMIRIVTLDKHGRPAIIETVETVTLPSDVILLNPGIPLNSHEFADWLTAWLAGPKVVLSLNKPDTTHQPSANWRPDR